MWQAAFLEESLNRAKPGGKLVMRQERTVPTPNANPSMDAKAIDTVRQNTARHITPTVGANLAINATSSKIRTRAEAVKATDMREEKFKRVLTTHMSMAPNVANTLALLRIVTEAAMAVDNLDTATIEATVRNPTKAAAASPAIAMTVIGSMATSITRVVTLMKNQIKAMVAPRKATETTGAVKMALMNLTTNEAREKAMVAVATSVVTRLSMVAVTMDIAKRAVTAATTGGEMRISTAAMKRVRKGAMADTTDIATMTMLRMMSIRVVTVVVIPEVTGSRGVFNP